MNKGYSMGIGERADGRGALYHAYYQPLTNVRNSGFPTTDRIANWRFIKAPSGNYYIKNGASGQYLTADWDRAPCYPPGACYGPVEPVSADLVLVTTVYQYEWSISRCSANNGVKLRLRILADKPIRRDRNGRGYALTSNSWTMRMTTACCESCPAGWTRISENTMECVVCDTETCSQAVSIPADQQVEIEFTLSSTLYYTAPDVPAGPIQSITTNSLPKYLAIGGAILKAGLGAGSNILSVGSNVIVAGEIVNKFGQMGVWASRGMGVVGIAVSVGLTFLVPSTEEIVEGYLNRFSKQLTEWTEKYVTDTYVNGELKDAIDLIAAARSRFMTSFRQSKLSDFSHPDLSMQSTLLPSLADLAEDISSDYKIALMSFK